jgi:hypothetical protein
MRKLSEILMLEGKAIMFDMEKDWKTVIVHDAGTGRGNRKVNITGDNIPAMIYDIMTQAKDLIL